MLSKELWYLKVRTIYFRITFLLVSLANEHFERKFKNGIEKEMHISETRDKFCMEQIMILGLAEKQKAAGIFGLQGVQSRNHIQS